jgi:hypothetical protein
MNIQSYMKKFRMYKMWQDNAMMDGSIILIEQWLAQTQGVVKKLWENLYIHVHMHYYIYKYIHIPHIPSSRDFQCIWYWDWGKTMASGVLCWTTQWMKR